ncbi:MAG: Gfo/Idh/MocA family oxidoreductase [Gammaproteobacteria bacterium]|nr:Gfo/Idh/MocA family oxidoreductase [Gammaproteobacteria bacterium]
MSPILLPDSLEQPPVRVGVIGLGNMGRNHVRVLSELPQVELVAVADPSDGALEVMRRSRRARTYLDYLDMFDREDLEAVVVAVPTSAHEEVVQAALSRNLHFLVEKPLAPTVEAARRIVDAADGRGLVGTVGHIERYNPALAALRRGVVAGEIGRVFQLRAVRTGPLPDRIRDVGVIVDLATHELDVIRYLVGKPIDRLFAETARRMHSDHEDLSVTLMRFADGTIALLDVNWLTPVKVRELTVIGEGGMYRLDYVAQDLYFYENSYVGYWAEFGGRNGVSEGNMVKYRIDRAEPLRVELEAFVRAIRGEEGVVVPLADGLAAVTLAEAVRESARLQRAVRDIDVATAATILD